MADATGAIKVLLTIDLTQNVAQEAIDNKCQLIMAYHPFIFKGLKLITNGDPQQRSLLKLIQNNIAVYCPHTAVDSQKGGVNDFLVDTLNSPIELKKPLEPATADIATSDCGMGRLVTFLQPVALSQLIANIKSGLALDHVQVGYGRNQDGSQQVKTVAICAGSGGGVFRGVNADLYYTGELSHHEALYFTECGSSVVVCNHTNTERAFLNVFKDQLQGELQDVEVIISKADHDPLVTV